MSAKSTVRSTGCARVGGHSLGWRHGRAPMSGFTEVADRVWVARYEWFDVNVTAIGGAAGLLLVGTPASHGGARGVLDDLRPRLSGHVRAVVDAPVHFEQPI